MSESVRCNLYFPADAVRLMDDEARQLGLTRTAYLRRAMGITQTADRVRREGYHVGASRDREALEVLIAAPV